VISNFLSPIFSLSTQYEAKENNESEESSQKREG